MKKLITILLLLILSSCNLDYEIISTEVINGKISAIDSGYIGSRISRPTRYWIQTSRTTKWVDIHELKYEKIFKVGDSVILMVQKVKEIK